MSSALSKCIVQPCRLASIVDWKRGALLALDIQTDRIALAIANPTNDGTRVHRLQSIPYKINTSNNDTTPYNNNNKIIRNAHDEQNNPNTSHEWREAQKQAVYNEILDIVQDEDVSGFVCAWPLETSGQPGKSCGQTFHLLDYFIEQNEGLLTRSRPLTLWDERQWTHQTYEETTMPQDVWGRSSLFSRAPPSQILNMSTPTIRYPPRSSSSSSTSSHCIHEEDEEYDSSSSSLLRSESSSTTTACVDSDDMACLVLENFVSLYFDTEEDGDIDHHHHQGGIDSKRLNQGLIESLVQYDQFGGSGNHFSLAPL